MDTPSVVSQHGVLQFGSGKGLEGALKDADMASKEEGAELFSMTSCIRTGTSWLDRRALW